MINAKCYSDNRAIEVNFDATSWFEQASAEAIKELSECQWGGDYPADDVVLFMASDKRIQKMLDYCEASGEGFECQISAIDAFDWIRTNRPTMLSNLCLYR